MVARQGKSSKGAQEALSTMMAAQRCGVHYTTIRRWILEGQLAAFETPGGHLRILTEDMDSFIELRRLKGARRPDAALRVLVVDDDEGLRDSVATFLGREPRLEVQEAADGFTAGRLVAEFQPDVVILDLLMAGMDGFAVCRSIRASRRSRHIRILVLTGFPTEENVRRAKECGADIVLAKPVELDELKEQVLHLGGVRADPVVAMRGAGLAYNRG